MFLANASESSIIDVCSRHEASKRINSLDALNRYRNLKVAFGTTGKKLCRAKRISTTTEFLLDWRSQVSSLVPHRLGSRERDLRHPPMAPSTKTFADVQSVSSTRSVFIMQSRMQNFRARKACEMFYLFGKRFKLIARAISSLREDRRLTEHTIFTFWQAFSISIHKYVITDWISS